LTVSINTSYPKVWNEYFKDILKNRSRLNASQYNIPAPVKISTPAGDFWRVDLHLMDVNKFTSTISYLDVKIK
jgi:hypothetical protein